ncbi:restriction endonuclease subunit S [Prevotella sp. AGR2160]|uniref:restriction endonuclease subunit S n=1 Tax=Prevotella sp. AGR2160 TaxID=1280674 RepID=UPI0006846EDA|nr:restriction endonuclease subunit S [Prevotella sp. AGR2160]
MIETKFKDTEIGKIPEKWGVVKLSAVASNFTGLTYHPEDVSDHGTLVLRSSNIQNGFLSLDDKVYVNMYIPDRAKVQEHDILICVRNGSSKLIGKSTILDKRCVGAAFGAFMTILRVYKDFDYKYVSFAWQSDYVYNQIHGNSSATINQITNKDINACLIALPSLSEQRRIATALSNVDALIAAVEKKIEKKKLIKQGAMQQLLTGKKRLNGYKGEWSNVNIGSLCKLYGRIGFRGYTKNDLVEKGMGAITFSPSDIHDFKLSFDDCDYISFNKYEESPEIKVYNGDILFCKTASIGKCAIVTGLNEKATINPQFVVMKDFKCDNHFLYYKLIDDDYQAQVLSITGGSTIPTMSQEKLKEQRILIPIDISEQRAIASILSNMDSEITALERKRDKLKELKQGMMQQLLTGKIRLV